MHYLYGSKKGVDQRLVATFGSELDAVSKAQLERGYRLVELLKQPLNSPMPVEEQVVSIFAGTKGYLDDLPVADVRRFEHELIDYMRGTHAGMLSELKTGGVPEGLGDIVATFKQQFTAGHVDTSGKPVDPTATDADEVGDAESAKTLATE